ncbi:MAG: hypothetical protein D3909_07460, partial [Candidatus Electrothrix sp. ATG1]|nr:hypothetical protein [Candidatus Electrothrix sp. ATG1]
MTNSLTGSVGEGGKNRPDDVRTVYGLFNKLLSVQLEVSDICSTELIQAIRDFQQGFMSRPDGRIDVSGRTWRKLTAATEAPATEISGSVGQGGQNRARDVRIVSA